MKATLLRLVKRVSVKNIVIALSIRHEALGERKREREKEREREREREREESDQILQQEVIFYFTGTLHISICEIFLNERSAKGFPYTKANIGYPFLPLLPNEITKSFSKEREREGEREREKMQAQAVLIA